MVERDQLTLEEKGSSLSFLIIGWIIPDRLIKASEPQFSDG